MTNKRINGSMAAELADAVEHLAKLELAMRDLRRLLCYGDEEVYYEPARLARQHCNKLIEALKSIDWKANEERIEAADRKWDAVVLQESAMRVVK
jgi:hypothetical protein